jgi:hypothetical protein
MMDGELPVQNKMRHAPVRQQLANQGADDGCWNGMNGCRIQ